MCSSGSGEDASVRMRVTTSLVAIAAMADSVSSAQGKMWAHAMRCTASWYSMPESTSSESFSTIARTSPTSGTPVTGGRG